MDASNAVSNKGLSCAPRFPTEYNVARETFTVCQPKAIEWGLNIPHAFLFGYLYQAQESRGLPTFIIAIQEIADAAPMVSEKPDTILRMLKSLKRSGLIALTHGSGLAVISITDKGLEWLVPGDYDVSHLVREVSITPNKKNAKKPIPKAVREFVLMRDGLICLRCGCADEFSLSADHVVPEVHGGKATPDNLQTLCMPCNRWKGTKTIDFRVSVRAMSGAEVEL